MKLLSSLLLFVIGLLFPAFSQTVTHTNVAYGSDPAQVMDIYVPPGNAVHPTIVMIHGGGWISGDKLAISTIAQYFAGQGYTTANINYRLATPNSNQYPAALNDAKSAILFLQTNRAAYKVDGNRIAAFGTSAGANLALTLGTNGWVKAVIDFYGPTDFTDPNFWAGIYNGQTNDEILATYFGVSFAQNPVLYAEASPKNNLSKAMPPTIIFHGSSDAVVPVDQSEDLDLQLDSLGVVCTLNIETGLGHGFLTDPGYNTTPVLRKCVAFLKAHMP